MSTLYAGKGVQLYRASSNPQEPVWLGMREPDPVIPTATSSMGVALNAGIQSEVNVLFAAAPAGTAFSIMYAINPDFSDEYALSAVASVALQTLYTWTTQDIRLSGFIRVTNSGGQSITSCFAQQTSATWG